MTFDKTYWAKADVGMPYSVQQIFNYLKIDETLATIVASAYFNDLVEFSGDTFRKYDLINIQASDDVGIYQVTSETNATPVTLASVIDASIIPAGAIMNSHVNAAALIAWSKMALLTEGNLLLGSVANVATVTDFSTDTQIGVGDGTTFASVAVSGDATLANTGALTIVALAITNAKVATAAAIDYSKLAALAEGSILLGDNSNVAVVTDVKTDTQILVGNGTTIASVAMSGDATLANTGALTIAALAIDNGKVATAAAIAWSKMAALTEGNLLLGDNSNVAVVTDFSTNAQIGIGDGTTFASVAVSGDIAIDNAGATTIQAGAVDEAMIAPNTLTGLVVANVADANVIGGLPQIFRINTAGGATANTDVTVTHKIRVIDVWVVNTGLGTAGDTIEVYNGANAITDAIDINNADKTVGRVTTIDDAFHEIAASGTLRVTETDGGGVDSPSTTVYVSAIRVA